MKYNNKIEELIMKRLFKIVIGVLAVLMVTGITTQLKAQVYGEFDTVRVIQSLYTALPVPEAGNMVVDLPKSAFKKIGSNDVDPDDGYALIDIGFDFEFNGEIYNKLWINVNGFVTFGRKENNVVLQPPFLAPKDQEGLFLDANSYPVNVIAPFWGDHYYRDIVDLNAANFKPSVVRYKADGQTLIIEWKDLNINYRYENRSLKNSIGNFQLVLIKSQDDYSRQGDIEFHYGTVGGNTRLEPTDDTRIVTKGSTIGIKGEGKIVGTDADYLNAFINNMYLKANPNVPYITVTTSKQVSNDWPPTNLKEAKFYFNAMKRFNVEEWWGDGDVDYSKAPGNKHYNFGYPKQPKFVTVNDARIIMKAIATETPLDPIRRRSAYHGDVNHNGRYYYDAFTQKKLIKTQSKNYADDLPAEVSSIKQILFEVTEKDAAIILHYIAAKVPELPWLRDTSVIRGKSGEDFAALDLRLNSESIGNGYYNVPVYLNTDIEGPISLKAKFDANIVSVNSELMSTFNNGVLVLAGSSKFNANQPMAYVTLKSDNNELNAFDIRLNDEQISSKKLSLNNSEITGLNVVLAQNPVNNSIAQFVMNINEKGTYKLSIFDMFGNQVAVVASGNYEIGSYNVNFDASALSSSAYIYRLEGNGNVVNGKFVINK